MKCKVRLTRTVELFVEGKDEDIILDWLRETTPEAAYLLTDGNVEDSYDEEILCSVSEESEVDYTIQND